jgi:hypothetical protein
MKKMDFPNDSKEVKGFGRNAKYEKNCIEELVELTNSQSLIGKFYHM